MRAFFDPVDGNAKVELEISGTTPNFKKTIIALLDTGHSGSLSLPVIDLIEIGAKLSSVGNVEYANGHTGIGYYFSAHVTLDGVTKEVQAMMIDNPNSSEAIAGLQLFTPYIAIISFGTKQIVFETQENLKKMIAQSNTQPPPTIPAP